MRSGVRSKLFVVSLSIIVVVGGTSALWLENSLRHFLERRVEKQLVATVRTVHTALRGPSSASAFEGDPSRAPAEDGPPRPRERLDAWLKGLAASADVRLTVVDRAGRVVAESDVPFERLTRLDDHGHRPEVLEAHRRGLGLARRFSETVDADLLYAALPFGDGEPVPEALRGGTVRAATPLASVDAIIEQLRNLLVLAGVFGLILAILMTFLASHLLSRALRRLVDHARALSSGQSHRIAISSTDEIGRLAGSFNRLADELESTMATLAVERGQLEAILDSMSEAVLVLDERLRVLLVNPETERLLGIAKSPIGQPLRASIAQSELEELARRGTHGRAQAEFVVPGERPRTVLARATPLREAGGTVIVIHDVTDVRRLENVRKDFVANVSHELRTPVSIVQANAETLLDGGLSDPSRARVFVEALHRNAERLSRIIADLLDLSRLESGRYRFELGRVELQDAVEGAMDIVGDRAGLTEQRIEIEVPESQAVRADPKALEQVLANLLENALKYAPAGPVRVRAEALDGEVRIEEIGRASCRERVCHRV